jgi:predicted DNA-binding protein
MKKYSLRMTNTQAQWLQNQARDQGLSLSEYLRNLVDKEISKPTFMLYSKKINKNNVLRSASEKKEISYTIMAYKLLEQLILSNELGVELRKEAYTHTLDLLTKFKIHPNELKEYPLTIWLTLEQGRWLEQQSHKLSKRSTYLLRKILLLAFDEGMQDEQHFSLHPAQKEGVKFTIITCKLLENYIVKTHENGAEMIESAYQESQELYIKLYPNGAIIDKK